MPRADVYGTLLVESEETTPATTSSGFPDPTPYLAIAFKAPAGRYRIGWAYEWGMSATNQNMLVQVDLNGGTILGDHIQMPQQGAISQKHQNGGFAYVTLADGTHTLNMEWGVSAGTGQIHQARLEIVRVDD